MKIFHTADWHLGKVVFNLHLTEDQSLLLDQLIKLIKKEKPTVLIIAGDIYDRSIPPVEAVELLNNFFTEIITTTQTQIIAIAGNHDSPDRLNFAGKIIKKQGLHIISKSSKGIEKIILKDEFGPINFYPIPYSEPANIRELYADEKLTDDDGNNLKINSHDVATKLQLSQIDISNDERNICIGHGYIIGSESNLKESSSERPLSIGGSASIPASYFSSFDYVALGHLHRPQKVGSDNIRYAGSLMKYSFSEVNHKKEIRIIELNQKGDLKQSSAKLKPEKDFRVIKGSIQELANKDFDSKLNSHDYIKAIITDKGEIMEPMAKLRVFYPNILCLEIERETASFIDNKLKSKKIKDKNRIELFNEFFLHTTTEELNELQKEKLEETCARLDKANRLK